ncbi:hypothetical protein GDO78_010202 [Eleutherodactylus coqui]|uniref:Secreted protein n=1 Tax=Eleutherodactylus coqui TaxID=57060 RepID=A0A8J6F367_ELECQ|nr:hypothetical protein GDO78_010202 [Eleutherodactylus coqui]
MVFGFFVFFFNVKMDLSSCRIICFLYADRLGDDACGTLSSALCSPVYFCSDVKAYYKVFIIKRVYSVCRVCLLHLYRNYPNGGFMGLCQE